MAESHSIESWTEIITAWQKSGLSQSEFCRKNKLKPSAFFYWRRRIEAIQTKPKKKGSNGKTSKRSVKATPEFMEIPLSDTATAKESRGRVLRFTTSYGATIEIPL